MVASSFSHSHLSQLGEVIATWTGLHFPRERWRDLERGLRSLASELGFGDVESCIQWLLSAPLTRSEIQTLASHLTVGETYFFREKEAFDALEAHIFPALIHDRRGKEQRLRVWSAGCSTGEEPYSIAVLLDRMIPDLKGWDVTILGTDVNPRFLQKAIVGVYGEWSFRGAPQWLKERYFKRTKEGRLEILPRIKELVKFSCLNLVQDIYPSLFGDDDGMDVIFCRNVLMYFAPEQARRVISLLHLSLADGGWLIVSPTESSHVFCPHFTPVSFPGVTLYCKPHPRPLPDAGLMGGQSACALGDTGGTMVPSPSHRERVRVRACASPGTYEDNPLLNESEEGQATAGRAYSQGGEGGRPAPYDEALVLYGQGRYAEAIGALVGWLSDEQTISPPSPSTDKAMALVTRAYGNLGNLAEGIEWCEKGIARNRLDPGLHYLRATILQEQGQLAEAAASLKRALYLDPGFVLAHFALGNLALRQGSPRESKRHFENALSLLRACQRDDTLPESEGMTAGRLAEVIRLMSSTEGSHGEPQDIVR